MIIFDEKGRRARVIRVVYREDLNIGEWASVRLTVSPDVPASANGKIWYQVEYIEWRPTWAAVRMAREYRLLELDSGYCTYLEDRDASDLWQPFRYDQPRFPNLAAVEMYLRMKGAE